MARFNSIFKDDINSYLSLRKTVLGDSAMKHDICYLASFDTFLANIGLSEKEIPEPVFNKWQKSLTGKPISKAGIYLNSFCPIPIYTKGSC